MKLGLILEGGGVKGAYQAGVMIALAQVGAHFDGVAGTSIGAVNGAMLLCGGYEKVISVWENVKLNTVFDFTNDELEKIADLKIAPAIKEYIKRRVDSKSNLFEQSYLKSQTFFKDVVDEKSMRESEMEYGLVTYDVSTFSPVEIMMKDIKEGQLVDFVIASATFPIFPPKVIENRRYIDGGVYDNMPINLLARNGYDKMLVIRTNVMSKAPKRQMERDGLNLFYLAPKEDIGPAMAFSSTRVHKFMQMGYEDCRNALDHGLKEFLQV